jgi:formylglycine-generating enzyme required for sulfatase activity
MRRVFVLCVFAACHSTGEASAPSRGEVAEAAVEAAVEVDAAVESGTVTGSGSGSDGGTADADAGAPEGMLLVPGGTFTMGADSGGEEDEHPAHAVTLKAFWLDRTEVTNEAYLACVKAGACTINARTIASQTHAGPDASFTRPKQPVVGVRWDDAKAFCGWKGMRLPTEAEFERAVRDDDGRRYPWGNEKPTADRTVFSRAYGRESTDDVGSHPTGRGPYGHDDLAGNVWEWMEDEYDPYAYRRATAAQGVPGTCPQILAALAELRAAGKQGFTGSNAIPIDCEHVLRGGAYNYDWNGLRSTNRVHHPGRFRLVMTGFRCAKDAE